MKTLQKLLHDVSTGTRIVKEAKNRFASQLAPDFSIFNYFRTDEMAISSCIAGLLDPKGNHGQGSTFLNLFIVEICSSQGWIKNIEECKITTEKQANEQRRIDIYLEFTNGCIGIENKPWASDQRNQLSDYADYLDKNSEKKNWALVYICNRDPQEESIVKRKREELITKNKLIECNFSQLVTWLIKCKEKSQSNNVRTFLEDFIKFVKIDINEELDMTEEAETEKYILLSKENLAASFDIFNTIKRTKKTLLQKFKSDLSKELNGNNLHLVWDASMDDSWKSCTGFGVKFQEHQDIYLRFEFEGSDLWQLAWGFKRKNESVKKANDQWDEISKSVSNIYGPGKNSEWWPWYSSNTKILFGRDLKNWGKDKDAWIWLLDSSETSMAKVITQFALKTRGAFNNDFSCLLKRAE